MYALHISKTNFTNKNTTIQLSQDIEKNPKNSNNVSFSIEANYIFI